MRQSVYIVLKLLSFGPEKKYCAKRKEEKITCIKEAVAELKEGLATYFTILKALILGHGQEAVAELEEGLATLLEMFPHCCRVEAAHCLTLVLLSQTSNLSEVRWTPFKTSSPVVLLVLESTETTGSYFS